MTTQTVVVFATSFLDELQTHPEREHEARAMLATLAEAGDLRVEYRCDRNPQSPLEASELEGVAAVIADLERYDAHLLSRVGVASGGSLQLIARYGAGYESVDLEAAERAGVMVTNTPGANAAPTAEWSVATLLDVAGRRIPHHARAAAGLTKHGPSRLDVQGKTLGIVGTGAIGRNVAALLAGFNPRIIASDPFPNHEWAAAVGAEYLAVDELCERADFITLHAATSHQIIGAAQIARMRSTTVLINCARAVLVDNRAVHRAVAEGRLWGYGMDDLWTEPDLALDSLNIALSPHVGSDTDAGKVGMRVQSAEAVVDYFSGRRPASVVVPWSPVTPC